MFPSRTQQPEEQNSLIEQFYNTNKPQISQIEEAQSIDQQMNLLSKTKRDTQDSCKEFSQKQSNSHIESSRQHSQLKKTKETPILNASLAAKTINQQYPLDSKKKHSPFRCIKQRQITEASKDEEQLASNLTEKSQLSPGEGEIICDTQLVQEHQQQQLELSPKMLNQQEGILLQNDIFSINNNGQYLPIDGKIRDSKVRNDQIVKRIVYNGNNAQLKRIDKVQEKVQNILNNNNNRSNKKPNLDLTLSALSPQNNDAKGQINRIFSSRQEDQKRHLARFSSPESLKNVNSQGKSKRKQTYQFGSGLKQPIQETKEVLVTLFKDPTQINKRHSSTSRFHDNNSANLSLHYDSNHQNTSPENHLNNFPQHLRTDSGQYPPYHQIKNNTLFQNNCVSPQLDKKTFNSLTTQPCTNLVQKREISSEGKSRLSNNSLQVHRNQFMTPLKSMISKNCQSSSEHTKNESNETAQQESNRNNQTHIFEYHQQTNKSETNQTSAQSKINIVSQAIQSPLQKQKNLNTAENLETRQKLTSSEKPQQTTTTTQENIISLLLGGDQEGDIYDTAFNMSQFIIQGELGKGAYATVKKAIDKNTGEVFALKIYQKFTLTQPNKMRNVKREMSIIRRLNHQNIIRLHAAFQDKISIVLILEYSSNLSLNKYLKNKFERRVPEIEAKLIFRQLVKGIEYCHQKNILHRDIKLDNILIEDSNKSIKIIDFGFSICSATKLKISCGTLAYMAPEIISKIEYCGKKADVWALGVVLYALVCGRFPFRGLNDSDLCKKIISCSYPIPANVSSRCANLLKRILKFCPEDRPDCKEILKDPWFA